MAAARHHVSVILRKICTAGDKRYWDFHRVNQIKILIAGFCTWAHAENSVFAVEIDGDIRRNVSSDKIRNPPAEIHVNPVGQFHSSAFRNLFPSESRFRHSASPELARCDLQKLKE